MGGLQPPFCQSRIREEGRDLDPVARPPRAPARAGGDPGWTRRAWAPSERAGHPSRAPRSRSNGQVSASCRAPVRAAGASSRGPGTDGLSTGIRSTAICVSASRARAVGRQSGSSTPLAIVHPQNAVQVDGAASAERAHVGVDADAERLDLAGDAMYRQ